MKYLLSIISILAMATGCVGLIAENRQQTYVLTHPELNEVMRQTILNGGIEFGMTYDQVIASRGKPHKINRSRNKKVESEQWIYGLDRILYTLYFEKGRLSRCEDSGVHFEICPNNLDR
jgi:hypothetical protein